ncbi:hypothetical protein M405DRAFT_868756 [Rhizopogon salebrosus TDB-379]|nr:hypothetical protein M405DRAFT_868756 [Rhizopogon salebrosus TDB-379]
MTLRSEARRAAMQVSLQSSICFIMTQAALEEFVFIMRHNPRVRKGLSGLYITFNQAPPFVKTLRELLSHAHKLEDLRLEIPNLKLLQTSAPHEVLAEFLQLHRHIEFLDITSPCDCKYSHHYCVLGYSILPNLVDLTGPTPCVAEIPDKNPIQGITLTCPTVADEEYPFYSLTLNIRTACDTLTQLTLGFNPGNQDLLRRIRICAPMLRELRLYESTHSNIRRGPLFPCPWDDVSNWARQLSLLEDLRSFRLSTYVSLVNNKGNRKEEVALAFQWTSEEHNGRCREQTLTRISLQYLKGSVDETNTILDFNDGSWV